MEHSFASNASNLSKKVWYEYEIILEGVLDASWSDWLDGVSLTRLENGQTLLTCKVPDQSALHGLLARIRDLNLKLISVKKKGDGRNQNHENQNLHPE